MVLRGKIDPRIAAISVDNNPSSPGFYMRAKKFEEYFKKNIAPNLPKNKNYITTKQKTKRYIPPAFRTKQISPKRYSTKTKHLLAIKIYDIAILELSGEGGTQKDVLKIVVRGIDIMKAAGVSEKMIRSFILPFISAKSCISKYGVPVGRDSTLQEIWMLNGSKLHWLIDILFENTIEIVEKMTEAKIEKKRILSGILKELSSYDFSSMQGGDLDKMRKHIQYISQKTYLFDSLEDKPYRIAELVSWMSMTEEDNLKSRYEAAKKDLSVADIDTAEKYAKKMGTIKEFFSLVSGISEQDMNKKEEFAKQPAIDTPLVTNGKNFFVGVYPHNNGIGMLGGNVNGVCIAADGDHRISQMNKGFLNLCVINNERVVMWGLLCSAKTKSGKEQYWILNNLQGGINSSSVNPEDVKEAIYKVFGKLLEETGAKGVLYKNNYFNAISLSSEEKADISAFEDALVLDRKIRLDFSYDPKTGVVKEKKMNIFSI